MDNNLNPAAPQAAPVAPQQPVTPVVQEDPPKGDNKKMLWLIVGLVILILVAGGVYWYMNQQRAGETEKTTPTKVTEGVDTLEKDLNSTSLDDLDKEFSSVDTDLKSL